MFYEEFSPEARKIIDQIRQSCEDIKNRKIKKYTIAYFFDKNDTCWKPYQIFFGYYHFSFFHFINGIALINILSSKEELELYVFLHEKHFFFPIFKTDSRSELTKYPFIAQ